MNTVLILGSAPNAVEARDWDRAGIDHIMAINNAYAVRPDWDSLIHPEDFPQENVPTDLTEGQSIVTAEAYVSAQNLYGGFVYAGGTMAFTAGYWALRHHKPRVLAYFGCDMVYKPTGNTHFYGTGEADPLRADVTLQSLEAKSARLMIMAAEQGCAVVNLSQQESRLVFPRAAQDKLASLDPLPFDRGAAQAALRAEEKLGYIVPSGRYWEVEDQFDAAALAKIDALWLQAALAPAASAGDI
ncbi:MAG: hypothetical protein OXC60_06485 [Litoreibacter sp.]|nr:hypothetical protein [Litoreibacter sp.]